SPLPPAFFQPDPVEVAPRLLGKLIVRRFPQPLGGAGERLARIVETEAYRGLDDPAAHASHGLTPRTAILYGPPGRAYIYLSYGIHLCLNVSTRPDGTPGGVLFRAAVLESPAPPRLLRGPGLLTRALDIPIALNGSDLTRPGPLFLADDGAPPPEVAISTRV